MKALLDGDVLVYACGFSCESAVYTLYYDDKKLNTFESKKEIDKFADGLVSGYNYDASLFVVDKHINIPPLSHVLHVVKAKIEFVLERTQATDYEIYLTGKNNFRDTCSPDLDKYKGNRDRDLKPYHYEDIKSYLINVWDAKVVDGIEADDALGLAQNDDSIICTVDKDLNQIPGLHFNWDKDIIYTVSVEEGIRYYYYQMLKGDTTDNIKGVPGIGEKRALAIVEENELVDLPQLVEAKYIEAFGDKGIEIMNQTDKLIKIKMDLDD